MQASIQEIVNEKLQTLAAFDETADGLHLRAGVLITNGESWGRAQVCEKRETSQFIYNI